MRTLALLLAAAAAASAAPVGASVKDGVDAWSRGDFAAAVARWQGPAAAGDADAQFNLAQAYKLGRGVPVDLQRAEQLYRRAADRGHLQAGDAYGLLLFQSGRRKEALPWITATAARGEPRAQYVLGIAHYNGDLLPRDPVRAYALMTRASAAGLEQARIALASMDEQLPLAERQQGVALAATLEQQAADTRSRELAAADLGVVLRPEAQAEAAVAAVTAARQAVAGPSATAGADYANPTVTSSQKARSKGGKRIAGEATSAIAAAPAVAAVSPAPADPAAAPRPQSAPARVAEAGRWRIQLGAFAQPGNADALWKRLARRGLVSGLERFDVGARGLTRLQAGPFASEAEAERACAALKAAGQACLAIRP